jgi:hypothetical protein
MSRIEIFCTAVVLTLMIGSLTLAAPPYFTNCPQDTLYGRDFNVRLEANEDAANLPYSFGLIGPGVITPWGDYAVDWQYQPDPTVWSDTVPVWITLSGSEDPGHFDTCYYATRTPFEGCGDNNNSGSFNILDVTYMIAYLYLGGPGFWNDYAADVNCDGAINILDIWIIIFNLYQNDRWQPLACCNARHEFPTSIGSWWDYERLVDSTGVIDTVHVEVINWDTFEYTYPDHADTIVIEFTSADDLAVPGPPGRYTYYDFIMKPLKAWYTSSTDPGGDPSGYDYEDSVVIDETVTVPAGTFDKAFRIFRFSRILFKDDITSFNNILRMEWFKRGVGMVMIQKYYDVIDISPDELWRLIDYDIE